MDAERYRGPVTTMPLRETDAEIEGHARQRRECGERLGKKFAEAMNKAEAHALDRAIRHTKLTCGGSAASA